MDHALSWYLRGAYVYSQFESLCLTRSYGTNLTRPGIDDLLQENREQQRNCQLWAMNGLVNQASAETKGVES